MKLKDDFVWQAIVANGDNLAKKLPVDDPYRISYEREKRQALFMDRFGYGILPFAIWRFLHWLSYAWPIKIRE